MEKNYRYAIRKTSLGVGSVAIGVFLAAGQLQTVQAAEATREIEPNSAVIQPSASETTASTTPSAEELGLDTNAGVPMNEALNTAEPAVNPREGVAKTADGTVRTEKNDSLAADEANVDHYRDSDLANNGVSAGFTTEDVGTTKEGVTATVVNPSPTSSDKKKFGIQIDIDREKSERTYTGVYVTDNKRGASVKGNAGQIVKPGEDPDFAGVNYPKDDIQADNINASVKHGRQVEIGISTGEEFLKDLNKIDNKKTNFAWKSEYIHDNPNTKMFTGKDFAVGFSVNPYPNENKNLSIIKVVGDTTVAKVPVKGQYIKTGARIENLDPEDYTRISSEVYHPDGTVVDSKEAQAILVTPDNQAEIAKEVGEVALGDIVFKMPKGALQDPNSIFNNDKFKGIQNLRARFFARPRTADEFKKIVTDINTDQGYEDKYYVETGAGTQVISHNNQNVTIDKQGIARYDHYNRIGEITINLDDTKYYDQSFKDQNGQETEKYTSSSVKPGEEFEVKMFNPESNPLPNQKSPEEMKQAKKDGEATGVIKSNFVDTENEKIAKKLGKSVKELTEDEKWTLIHSDSDITKFVVKPPVDAKAGDFIAVPVEYTYTNGSKDIHWFHFVVQADENFRPEYHAATGYQGDTLTKLPEPKSESDKDKKDPVSYELVPGVYKDNAGNVWDDVTINPNTGAVTAVVPENADIKGGESVYIPVKTTYPNGKTAIVKAQFIARPKNVAMGGHAVVEEIPFETHVIYDENLDIGVVKKTDGELGSKRTVYEWDFDNRRTVDRNGKKVEQPVIANVTETMIKEKKDAEIRIGVRPIQETVVIPKGLEVEIDNTIPTGETKVVDEGHDGEVTVKTVKNPQTGEITISKEETKAAAPKKIKMGAKTTGTVVDEDKIPFNYTVEFDPNFYTNYPDATENYKIVTPGKEGSNKKTWTIENSKIVGAPTVEKIDPVNAVIKVGQKDYTGEVTHTETVPVPNTVEIRYNPNVQAGETKVLEEGKPGSVDVTYTQKVRNGQAEGDLTKTEANRVAPVNRVIEVGTKAVEGTTTPINKEIPVEIEYVYDDTKDKGIVEKGELTPGQTKTEVVSVVENGKVVNKETTVVTPAKQKIIVGTKDFTGVYEYDKTCPLPYKVEVRENPELEAGKSKVIQEGKVGERTTHYKVNIVNGQVTGIPEETLGTTTDPVTHIVEVGTKKNPEMCEAPKTSQPGGGNAANPNKSGQKDPAKSGTDGVGGKNSTNENPNASSGKGFGKQEASEHNNRVVSAKQTSDKQNVKKASVLPSTGAADHVGIFTSASLAILAGLGLVGKDYKRDEEN